MDEEGRPAEAVAAAETAGGAETAGTAAAAGTEAEAAGAVEASGVEVAEAERGDYWRGRRERAASNSPIRASILAIIGWTGCGVADGAECRLAGCSEQWK